MKNRYFIKIEQINLLRQEISSVRHYRELGEWMPCSGVHGHIGGGGRDVDTTGTLVRLLLAVLSADVGGQRIVLPESVGTLRA